jgi:hypothetical protein
MKVLFFEPYAQAIPHYETALELIQEHINNGDDVSVYYCEGSLYFCEANYNHDLTICASCISRRNNGLKLIEGRKKMTVNVFENLTNEEEKFIADWDVRFKNVAEIKAFEFENTDLGMAVASSLISALRDANVDTDVHHEYINKIFRSALKVYFSFKRTLANNRPDVVYMFNGRFANLRVVMRLCELNNIPFRIHERGSNKHKYMVYENHLPHNVKAIIKLVEKAWENETDTMASEKIASDFYTGRKMGTEQSWFSFVAGQEKDVLPDNWNPNVRNIVIFNSSEDEFAAIGSDFVNDVFSSQMECFRYIIEAFKGREDIAVYVRMHPNLKGVRDRSTVEMLELGAPNFTVIAPESPISTYKLIDECDVVVSFGSNTGIEATFWGKPSILVGNTFYKALDVTYNTENQPHLITLLLTVNEPKPKIGTLKYGYFMATYGTDFKHYKAKELFDGEFKGVRIRPTEPLLKRIKNKIKSLIGSR